MSVDRRGLYLYGATQDESDAERARRERYWRSLGSIIRKAARIPRTFR